MLLRVIKSLDVLQEELENPRGVKEFLSELKSEGEFDLRRLAILLTIYAEYMTSVLIANAKTLEFEQEDHRKLHTMVSIIAELCVENGVPFYHPTEGYKLVDKFLGDFVDYLIADEPEEEVEYIYALALIRSFIADKEEKEANESVD